MLIHKIETDSSLLLTGSICDTVEEPHKIIKLKMVTLCYKSKYAIAEEFALAYSK